MKRTALFSLSNVDCADRFAAQLIRRGWNILATPETVRLLRGKGIPVTDISDFTGIKKRSEYIFPPTLHPKIEQALTVKCPSPIDLVYDIPYPVSEGNDVGGHTLLALAVKGGRIPVMCVDDMKKVISSMSKTGDIRSKLHHELIEKASFAVAKHYSGIMTKGKYDFLEGRFSFRLLNGENPYQIPASAFISETQQDPLSLFNFKKVSGEPPCFTNIADADSALRTMCLASAAFLLNTGAIPKICVAAKHGNACGMGISKVSAAEAIQKALYGNPRAVWGGEVITNFPINLQLAELLFSCKNREHLLGSSSWMLDFIMAPAFTSEAISVLGRRQKRKLFENSTLLSPSLEKAKFVYRPVRGGFLRQPPANYVLNLKKCRIEGRDYSEIEMSSLIIAWATVYSSAHGGNEIALAKNGTLLSVGGGPSTIDAATVAVLRAKQNGHEAKGSAFAANAFFPFTDAPLILCNAGVEIGSVPRGGRNETEVRDFFRTHNKSITYIPQKFRGFCRH